jgi:hypothetical protein
VASSKENLVRFKKNNPERWREIEARYKRKNVGRVRYLKYRSGARSYIRKASLEELEKFLEILKERLDALENRKEELDGEHD